MTFCPDGHVNVESVDLEPRLARRLNQHLMLFYTNQSRRAESVLQEQVQNIADRMEVLCELKQLAVRARRYLQDGDLDGFGCLLHAGWVLKQQMASRISNTHIDDLYSTARDAGALGGKIVGAGGGGYLLLYCPRERQEQVRDALRHLPELSFHLERDGSKVIFNYRR